MALASARRLLQDRARSHPDPPNPTRSHGPPPPDRHRLFHRQPGGRSDAVRGVRRCGFCPPPALPGDPCMTLSDPRRALLPLALALACATTAMPVLAQGLQTSFEPGEPAPTQAAGALQVTIGNGLRRLTRPSATPATAACMHCATAAKAAARGANCSRPTCPSRPIPRCRGWCCRRSSARTPSLRPMSRWTCCWTMAAACRPVRRATSMGWRSAHARRANRRRCTRNSGRARQCGWATYPR